MTDKQFNKKIEADLKRLQNKAREMAFHKGSEDACDFVEKTQSDDYVYGYARFFLEYLIMNHGSKDFLKLAKGTISELKKEGHIK